MSKDYSGFYIAEFTGIFSFPFFLHFHFATRTHQFENKKAPDLNETKLSVRQEFEVEVESPPNPDQIFITTNPDRDDLRLGQGILTLYDFGLTSYDH